MFFISEKIAQWIHLPVYIVLHTLYSFLWIFLLYLIRKIVIYLISRKTDDVHILYNWRKGITYAVWIAGFIILSRVWIAGFKSVATFLGLLSAGIAISLKDIIADIAGWLFILIRRPFFVGDRIQIGEYRGDVIDIRIFQFTLVEIGNWVDADQSTGRIIHIPNSKVITDVLANYSRGFKYIWNEISVLVTFESDWEKAKEILLDIATKHSEHLSKKAEKSLKEASKKFMIYFNVLTPTVYTTVEDSGIKLTVRYLCLPKRRRFTEHTIWEEILKEFNQNENINFAYNTYRIVK